MRTNKIRYAVSSEFNDRIVGLKMDAEKKGEDLNRRFAAPLPEFYKRRIIVWHDGKDPQPGPDDPLCLAVQRKSMHQKIKGRILSPGWYGTSCHVFVVLCPGTNQIPVHQIVMRTFVGNPPEGMDVLHKNGDPTDNRLENLRYGTRRENILDVYLQGGSWKKLSIEDVYAIIRFGLWCELSTTLLSKMYGMSQKMILSIKKKKSYPWLV